METGNAYAISMSGKTASLVMDEAFFHLGG